MASSAREGGSRRRAREKGAARVRELRAVLDRSVQEQHERIAQAAADALDAVEVKAGHLAAVQEWDCRAGTAVRAMLAEGLPVERVVELLGGAVTLKEVRRYAAVSVVQAQQAVESGRVAYADRPPPPPVGQSPR